MAESKKLVLVFKNSIGKEVTFTIEDPKDALTEAEIKAAMDLIVEKNIFKKNNYDLIILDIMMPNLDGYSACKMIRKTSNIPIIFLTALNQENDELKGFELECDDYITKPFSFNLLIKRVEAILRRSNTSTENSDSLSFEKLKLDLNTYTANIDGNIVELTLKEFNILKSLVEKYPQVITRESLLDSIWG